MTVLLNDTIERFDIDGTGPYAFNFRIFAETDLALTVISADGVTPPTVLAYLTHYTVDGANDFDGGTITLTGDAASAYDGLTLDIRSNTPEQQSTSIRNQGRFLPEIHEDAFDKLSRQLQDHRRLINAAIRAPDYEVSPMLLPRADLRANKSLSFGIDGSLSLSVLGSTAITASILVSLLSGSPAQMQELVGLINPRTPAEIAAGVTPTNVFFRELEVERYGADFAGGVDATAAFNQAFLVGAQKRGTVRSATGGTFKILGTLIPDVTRVGFDGNGCHINSSTKQNSDGDLWVPKFSEPDGNIIPAMARAHSLRNFTVAGPGRLKTNRCFYVNDSVSALACGLLVQNGGSHDWATHLEMANGGFFTSFQNWDFDSSSSGLGSTNFVKLVSGANNGERNVFFNCRFGDSFGYNVSLATGAATTILDACSFNYGRSGFVAASGGVTMLTNCHLESNNNAVTWVAVSGENTSVFVRGGGIFLAASLTAISPFDCAGTVTAGILDIDGLQFASSFPMSTPLVSGTGNTQVRGISQYQSADLIRYYTFAANRLGDGGFESNGLTADGWTASGGTPPTVVSANPRTGTRHLRIVGVNSQTNQVTQKFACLPGQTVTGELYAALSSYVTGTHLYGLLAFEDAGGNSLGGGMAFMDITANQAYSRVEFSTYRRAPAGTRSVSLTLQIFGPASGNPLGDIDDIVLTVA